MGTKLSGRLRLNLIPKELVQTSEDGTIFVYVDVVERKEVGKYGETHTLTMYNKEKRETIYLANLKPSDFGKGGEEPKKAKVDDDLPF